MGKDAVLDQNALDRLFVEARTYGVWQDREVPDEMLHRLYELMKFGPTEANTCPMRIVFVRSQEAKKRLDPLMDEGNRKKTMAAPVNAILAYDLKFYEHMDKLFPHAPGARSWFEGNQPKIEKVGLRNGSLQAAYFMIAARSLGLDCGPQSGFNVDGVKAEFFAGTDVVPNIVCNLGYGDPASLHPRLPRFEFDAACKVL
jgi:3-hydroxypropanoate dehydrogenase